MPKYVIERETPRAGGATVEQLRESAANSNQVIADLGPDIRWLESFVTDDKTYCVFVAPGEDIILEHARCAGIPADRISRVSNVIDPSWGE
jgi:Nickel responsive protein SCO4226-like